jgi:CHAD domain-containing protein
VGKSMKWRIKGLHPEIEFGYAAELILTARLKVLIRNIRNYFADESVENLHTVRISLRRLRYTLEIFYTCFNKKIFLAFYTIIEYLQDITGEVRDMDVLIENTLKLSGKKSRRISGFLINVEEKRNQLREQLRFELLKFIHSEELKLFKNHLNKKRK